MHEVVAAQEPRPGGVVIDCTFGRGGHALELLRRVAPGGRVIAMDRDPAAVAAGLALARDHEGLTVLRASFDRLEAVASEQGVMRQVDGILFDLGVSSPQLDEPERGFSFQHEGPLDMRMDPDAGPGAAEWLAEVEERELARVLRVYGEEPAAARVARALVRARTERPIRTTAELAALVTRAVPGAARRRRHPATRCFQAIRMAVNHELDQLEDALPQTLSVLAPGGRLAVISFHSLEDRLVKRFIRDPLGRGPLPRHLPVTGDGPTQPLAAVGRARRAGDDEVSANPRARSATLRVAERTVDLTAGEMS